MTFLQSLHNLLPMNMSSLSFVYVFLPGSLLAYHLAPKALRPVVLLAASLGFYALARPDSIMLAVASLLTDYALIWGVAASRVAVVRRGFLWACITKNAGMIIYFGFAAQAGSNPPLGLAVICVSGIDCALEAFREENPYPKGFIRVALYILFFPRLYAGPLMKYGEFCKGLADSGFDGRAVVRGFGRFAVGALKYAFFGRELFWLYNDLRLIPAGDANVLSAWLLVLSFMLSLYFTLSGLSDMAQGIGRMLGFTLPQNFYYPYQSRSVSDFFERFNITAGSFLKRTVYEPFGARWGDPGADSVNLLVTGLLWGAWFGFQANYIAWGMFMALFIIMERYIYPGVIRAMPTLFCRGYTFCVAVAGFAIFAGENLAQSLGYFRLMLSVNEIPFLGGRIDRILYALSSNWALLLLSCFFATNLTSLATDLIRRSLPRASAVVFGIAGAGILVLFTVITLGGGYV